jgi:CheY-specific phosphatase CheX
MVSKPTRERLGALVSGLLESAAFVFTEIVEDKPWASGDILGARVTLEHGERAELSLCLPSDLAPELAANLLALESDSEEARSSAGDAVGELANMLAGTLAVEVFGRDVVCKIGVPRVAPEAAADHDHHFGLAVCHVALQTDNGQRVDAALAVVPAETGRGS